MRRPFRFLAALAALVLAGCASTRPAPDLEATLPSAFPNHSVEAIHAALATEGDTLSGLRARASLSINSPAQSGSFSSDLRARRGDSLYLTVSPGLGIEAVRALVTADSVFVYDRLKNRVSYGALGEAGDLLAFPLAPDALFRNLLGFVVPETNVDWRLTADSATYQLQNAEGTITYTVDPAHWRVVRYEVRTPDGEVIEERTFSEFDRIQGVVVPRRVVFRRPADETTLALYYRSLELDPAGLSFPFRVNDSASWEAVGR